MIIENVKVSETSRWWSFIYGLENEGGGHVLGLIIKADTSINGDTVLHVIDGKKRRASSALFLEPQVERLAGALIQLGSKAHESFRKITL